MGKSTFMGGIHPFEGKELTMDKPTTVLLPKGDLIFPMSQHIGGPAKPVVAKGDNVLVGQKIGEATGFISANVISSVSGTVKAIEKRLTVTGKLVEAVIIENDNEYTKVEGYGEERDYNRLSQKEIREAIREAGIVGLGGAGFPTDVKLTPKNEDAIDYIVINGAECEPYLTSDYRLMIEEPEKVIGGLKILFKLFTNAKGIIAIEDNKPEAIKKFKELTVGEDNIEIQSLKTKYPQGGERQLVYVTTGRKLNSKKLPSDVGCIVNNVASVAAIYMAVAKNTPLIERIVTISGDAINKPGNFKVLIGTNFSDIVEAAGGFKSQPEKIIFGGPMMGLAMYTYDLPVTKVASSLLAVLHDEAAVEESPCIRCGRCTEVCPMKLVPVGIAKAAAHNDEDKFLAMDGMECCGCGCCSFVCPAKIGLAQKILQTKNVILANQHAQAD